MNGTRSWIRQRLDVTAQLGWTGRLAEALLLIMVLCGWTVGALLPRRDTLNTSIDFTREQLPDSAQYAGLYERESNDEFVYRWTSGSFLMQIPWAYHAAPAYLASIRLKSPLAEPGSVSFSANERLLAEATPGNTFRTYQLLMPPAAAADLRLALRTTPQFSPPDLRPLGVVITSAEFQGIDTPDWSALTVVLTGLLLIWLLLRAIGFSVQTVALYCLPMALLLLGLYRTVGPSPLPYAVMAAFGIASAAVAAAIDRGRKLYPIPALSGIVISFSGMIWPSWFSDDAFISFRYAQNLVAGNGLVYNVGERVEGYTNFLYTVLAAVVLRLGQDPVLWGYLSGVFFASAITILTYRLAAHLIGRPWALIALIMTGTSQSLLLHSARGGGLETALFALLLLSAAAVYVWPLVGESVGVPGPRRLAVTALLLALATLTRPEGALLFALTAGHALLADVRVDDLRRPGDLIRRKLSLAWLLAPYLTIMVPFFLWRYGYYGDLLPNTFYAKVGGGLRSVERGILYSAAFAATMGGPLLLVGLSRLFTERLSGLRHWYGYLLVVVGVFTLYIIAVGGDHFRGERFFVPLVALFAVLVSDGIRWIAQTVVSRGLPRTGVTAFLVLSLSLYSSYALDRTRDIDHIIRGLDEGLRIWIEIGWWMADNTDPDQSVAVLGAGAIAFYGQRETIDMLGLTDRHIARVEVTDMGSGTAGHEKSDPEYVLNQRRPTYVPGIWAYHFPDQAAFLAAYEPLTVTSRYGREMVLWKRKTD